MPIPEFTDSGDLPLGVHPATLAEVIARFGRGTTERFDVGRRLARIHGLAASTGGVRRFVVFGSFVTAKPAPNDVDVFLLMEDAFAVGKIEAAVLAVFDHQAAQERLGASVFWLRRLAALDGEKATVEYWQVTREGGRRGIVEIVEPRR
jgi:hypothetical protein